MSDPFQRCLFVEIPSGGGESRCPAEPVYRLWVDECKPCRAAGIRMGIADMDCVGHWACVRHGAEARAGKFEAPDSGNLTVRRIQSIGRPAA